MTNSDFFMENKVIWVAPATGVYNWLQPSQKYLFPAYPLYDDERPMRSPASSIRR
jgi:hypothetical protein